MINKSTSSLSLSSSSKLYQIFLAYPYIKKIILKILRE